MAESDTANSGSRNKPINTPEDPATTSILKTVIDFSICFFGLQISYLMWGTMQEAIMDTQFNATPRVPSGKFPSATFCVFSNRFLAIILSAIACYWKYKSLQLPIPFLSFAPCSLSNTLSSWSQYQALSYVSFSLQTIFKSTKILPVMAMGIILKGASYPIIEYVEAVLITVGVTTFSLSKSNWESADPKYEYLGVLLLCSYVLSDSFTSQWQSRLYREYGKIDQYQMMFGVNSFSIIITALALLVSGDLPLVIEFMQYNPTVLYYNIITAVTSATGQFAVYYTIKRFGPVVFTVIMTTRQMLSIVISNYLFDHKMTVQMYVGAALVFCVILYSTYRQFKEKKATSSKKASTTDIKDIEMPTTRSNS